MQGLPGELSDCLDGWCIFFSTVRGDLNTDYWQICDSGLSSYCLLSRDRVGEGRRDGQAAWLIGWIAKFVDRYII